MIRTLPNGVRTVWKYGNNGTLESIVHVAADDHVLSQFEYSYKVDGLIRKIRRSTAQERTTIEYEYDVVQRLVKVSDSKGSQTTLRYDALGNRVEVKTSGQEPVVSLCDWSGRLSRHAGQDCTHDPCGRRASRPETDGASTRFEFDGEGRLATVTMNDARFDYHYDGSGCLVTIRRQGETRGTCPIRFQKLGQPLLAVEENGSQTLYVWEDGVPLAAITAGSCHFYLTDHLGTVRCTTDRSGNLVDQFEYDAFHTYNSKA